MSPGDLLNTSLDLTSKRKLDKSLFQRDLRYFSVGKCNPSAAENSTGAHRISNRISYKHRISGRGGGYRERGLGLQQGQFWGGE